MTVEQVKQFANGIDFRTIEQMTFQQNWIYVVVGVIFMVTCLIIAIKADQPAWILLMTFGFLVIVLMMTIETSEEEINQEEKMYAAKYVEWKEEYLLPYIDVLPLKTFENIKTIRRDYVGALETEQGILTKEGAVAITAISEDGKEISLRVKAQPLEPGSKERIVYKEVKEELLFAEEKYITEDMVEMVGGETFWGVKKGKYEGVIYTNRFDDVLEIESD